jgi:hypothetical protein
MIRLAFLFSLIVLSCSETKHSKRDLNTDDINNILGQVQENDPVFTEKGIAFDSIVTLAGIRQLEGKNERIKMKLFYFGSYSRGYFNLPDLDIKNLQFFGKKIDNSWALKCVTKLNMEEAGGYMIYWQGENDSYEGIWSNGEVNFKQGKIILDRQVIDYNTLTIW